MKKWLSAGGTPLIPGGGGGGISGELVSAKVRVQQVKIRVGSLW